jgi:predicted PurR-regulated permease PerM
MKDDISYYLLTFAAVNAGIGVAMGVVTRCSAYQPLLWGTLVALLNFVPYVGAAVSTATLTFVGVITFDSLGMALAAPAIMLILAGLSAEVITPLVLGRGLRLNPVAIFIAIMLWGWLWGIVGVLLAVPLLASFKIICERVEPLAPIAEFLTQYVPPSEDQLAN